MSLIDTNADDVASWFYESEEELREDVEEFPKEAAKRTHKKALKEVPVDTGALKQSLKRTGAQVYSSLHYAPHVGLGTIYMDQQDYLWGPAKKEFLRLLKELSK